MDRDQAALLAKRLSNTKWGNRRRIIKNVDFPGRVSTEGGFAPCIVLERSFEDEQDTVLRISLYKEDEDCEKPSATAFLMQTQEKRYRSTVIIFDPPIDKCLEELLIGTHPSQWVREAYWPDR